MFLMMVYPNIKNYEKQKIMKDMKVILSILAIAILLVSFVVFGFFWGFNTTIYLISAFIIVGLGNISSKLGNNE